MGGNATGTAGAGSVVVVLGTGGTIAGVSTGGDDRVYQAAQLGVDQLVAAVPALAGQTLEAHQVAQVDSKDMGWAVWRPLLEALVHHLARPVVAGVVVTHGTDTLEETAWLLHLLLQPCGKPVVLTAAMRPATSPQADGPANLADAVAVARWAAARGRSGVVATMGGQVWAGKAVRKSHSWHVDAFDGGGQAALARVEAADVRPGEAGGWPAPLGWLTPALLALDALPRVEIITSHADADGAVVDALLAAAQAGRAAPAGLVIACTGHGTLHRGLREALSRAQAAGIAIWRSTRVARGGVEAKHGDEWPAAGTLTPAQARVALALTLALRPALLTSASTSTSTAHLA